MEKRAMIYGRIVLVSGSLCVTYMDHIILMTPSTWLAFMSPPHYSLQCVSISNLPSREPVHIPPDWKKKIIFPSHL